MKGLTDVDSLEYHRLSHDLFPILLIGTIVAIGHFVATTGVLLVPREFPFGFIEVLPSGYWLAVAMTLCLLFVSLSSGDIAYLWISSLLLIVLVPSLGSLVRSYPIDLFGVFASERILSSGGFSIADNLFLNFPGSTIIFSVLVAVTSASSLAVARAFGLVYNVILGSLSYVFFRWLGINPRGSVLAGLVFVLSFYMQGVLVSSSLMGMIFYVAITAVVFAQANTVASRVRTFLLALLFTAMIVSHAFSPFMTMTAMIVTLIGWKYADRLVRKLNFGRLFGDPPPTSPSILVPFLIILAAYWMYFASLIFTWGAMRLKSFDLMGILRGAASPLVSPGTIYASSYSHLAELYAPLLLSAFAVYLLTCDDRRKLPLVLWLLGLAGTVVLALGGYLQEFFARIFSFATLILCYGVARLFTSNRVWFRRVGIIVLLAALCLHLPAHYGQDSFLAVRETTVQGAKFIAGQPFSNETVDTIYSHVIYASDKPLDLHSESLFALSYQTENWIAYTEGDLALQGLQGRLRSTSYDRLYSNGSFDIYLPSMP